MRKQPTITYIKNGKEKTININFINKNIILNKLFDVQIDKGRFYKGLFSYSYTLKKEIDTIIFKNFTFVNEYKLFLSSSIKSLKKQNIQLINCTFFNKEVNLDFENIKIINPKPTKTNIIINDCNFAYIDLSKINKETALTIDQSKEVILISSDNLKQLKVWTKKANIKNLSTSNNPMLFLTGELTLEDSTFTATGIKIKKLLLINSSVSNNQDLTLNVENIILENSTINSKQTIYLKNLSILEFNDIIDNAILDNSSYLEAKEKIFINGKMYLNKEVNNLILTKDDLEKIEKILKQNRVEKEKKENEKRKNYYNFLEHHTSKIKKLIKN